jgi:hypothetical protein
MQAGRRRIPFSLAASMMRARMRMRHEQRGQPKGSDLQIFPISLAIADRQQDSGREGQEGCGRNTGRRSGERRTRLRRAIPRQRES